MEKRSSKYEVNLDRIILKGRKMEEDLREINLRIEEKIKKILKIIYGLTGDLKIDLKEKGIFTQLKL